MKPAFVYFLGFALCTIVDEISRQRMIRGIAPVRGSKPLDKFLLQYLKTDSDKLETKSVTNLFGEDACNTFPNSTLCPYSPVQEFLMKEGICIFSAPSEPNIYQQMDAMMKSEANKDILLNRLGYACTPFKTAASVDIQGQVYILLSPFGLDFESEYRPVHFPSETCDIKGMEAYTVPPSYTRNVRLLYNGLNMDLTWRDIKPFMFSNFLSMYNDSNLLSSALLHSPYISLAVYKSSNALNQLLKSPEYQALVRVPPEDSWPHRQAMGININSTHVNFKFSTNHPSLPELMDGVCKEPCTRYFID